MSQEFKTVADVERYGAESGIILTPTDKAKILATQKAELERLESLSHTQTKTGWAERWNGFYPMFLSAIISIGETILTFSQTIITALGVPVALVLLLIVEIHRVVEGIMLFDHNPTFALFASFALVLLNLVLEFQIHHIEHQHGYKAENTRRWSLRLWAQNMRYRLGLGTDWKAQDLSPASQYKGTLTLVTFTILALALVGSMRVVIEQTGGNWYQALLAIVTESSLLLIMTWAGGLLFALSAVISAQRLSRYVAVRTVEIVAKMQRQTTAHNPHTTHVEQAGANTALAIIREKQSKNDAKKKSIEVSSNPVPFGSIHPVEDAKEFMQISMNGNGSGSTKNGHSNGHSAN